MYTQPALCCPDNAPLLSSPQACGGGRRGPCLQPTHPGILSFLQTVLLTETPSDPGTWSLTTHIYRFADGHMCCRCIPNCLVWEKKRKVYYIQKTDSIKNSYSSVVRNSELNWEYTLNSLAVSGCRIATGIRIKINWNSKKERKKSCVSNTLKFI